MEDCDCLDIFESIKYNCDRCFGGYIGEIEDVNNIRDRKNRFLLEYASICNRPEMIEILIKKGASLDMFNIEGDHPVHISVRESHKECVKIFLRNGVDVNLKQKFDVDSGIYNYRYTPLHIAISNNNKDMVKFLLKKGADIYMKYDCQFSDNPTIFSLATKSMRDYIENKQNWSSLKYKEPDI